ncbi:hypothetical protein F2Q68_00012983 [Brassica cretica]|uniref:Helicase ATP-binding domain-containing protein n=1 Tax=Brassica cretica TaxID=69181 RepID=A0A8S9HYG4_BRACR|nr:hypothetical protein F2Q68_00012983 [Brassica cretica]
MGKKMNRDQNTELSDSSRIWASKFLKEFRASGRDSHTFDNSLTNDERGIIHQMCRKMAIRSKSSGKGDQRRLTIFKRAPRPSSVSGSEKKKLKRVSFPPEAEPILQDLFTHYPPCDGDTRATSLGVYTGQFGRQRKWKDDFFGKPQMNKEDVRNKAASLSSRLANDKDFREIFGARTKLPIASFREAITSAVESNQVVLIAGETGCGKTTQVRLNSKGGRQSSVVFCTNGILLRVLVGKGGGSCVPDITHIIVDEIHERDCYSDFMLAIIRDFLPSNPHLRLILMSATLDAERFSEYFGGCPVVQVPGFTYPVRTFYLEDVLSVLKSEKNHHLISDDSSIPDVKRDIKDEDKVALDEAIEMAWTNDEFEALLDLVSSEGSHEG